MCTLPLPPRVYPIAVKYIISYHIIPYRMVVYHITIYICVAVNHKYFLLVSSIYVTCFDLLTILRHLNTWFYNVCVCVCVYIYIYIYIVNLWDVLQFVRSLKFKINIHFIMKFKVMYLKPEDRQYTETCSVCWRN